MWWSFIFQVFQFPSQALFLLRSFSRLASSTLEHDFLSVAMKIFLFYLNENCCAFFWISFIIDFGHKLIDVVQIDQLIDCHCVESQWIFKKIAAYNFLTLKWYLIANPITIYKQIFILFLLHFAQFLNVTAHSSKTLIIPRTNVHARTRTHTQTHNGKHFTM